MAFRTTTAAIAHPRVDAAVDLGELGGTLGGASCVHARTHKENLQYVPGFDRSLHTYTQRRKQFVICQPYTRFYQHRPSEVIRISCSHSIGMSPSNAMYLVATSVMAQAAVAAAAINWYGGGSRYLAAIGVPRMEGASAALVWNSRVVGHHHPVRLHLPRQQQNAAVVFHCWPELVLLKSAFCNNESRNRPQIRNDCIAPYQSQSPESIHVWMSIP